MSSVARRRFFEELSALADKKVMVFTSEGKVFSGILRGYDPETLSVCISDASDQLGATVPLAILNGSTITRLQATEKALDLSALRERLERIFPKMVRTYDEAGVIVVMDKIRVSKDGLLEGTGPAAERVKRVYDEFIREQQKTQ